VLQFMPCQKAKTLECDVLKLFVLEIRLVHLEG